jgi:hypothetical protein
MFTTLSSLQLHVIHARVFQIKTSVFKEPHHHPLANMIGAAPLAPTFHICPFQTQHLMISIFPDLCKFTLS